MATYLLGCSVYSSADHTVQDTSPQQSTACWTKLSPATGQVRQLEEAEQLAVEQEDFESAANLSSELDALRSDVQPEIVSLQHTYFTLKHMLHTAKDSESCMHRCSVNRNPYSDYFLFIFALCQWAYSLHEWDL